jgi:uncharacterized membrane protein YjgN (DUF898 family)
MEPPPTGSLTDRIASTLGGHSALQDDSLSFTSTAGTAVNADDETVTLSWSQPDGLIGLSFANYVLRLMTLGAYHFWGKTEVRRRIWSAVRLNGEPLAYTGTGKELCVGFLIVFGVVLLPMTLVMFAAVFAFGPQSGLTKAAQILVYVIFFVLMGLGLYRAQRYRLSRTVWRGIRGGLEGSAGQYAWTHVLTALLIPLTLGWITPWRQTRLQSALVNDMRFGDRPLTFDGKSGPLYKRFWALWVGSLVLAAFFFAAFAGVMGRKMAVAQQWGHPYQPTPGEVGTIVVIAMMTLLLYSIISAWYRAGVMNHFAAHTHFEGATFAGTATAGGLIWLAVGNFCLTVFTLGLLAPLAQVRTARYTVQNTFLDGAIALTAIRQRTASDRKYGEGLAQAFDFDAF